MSNTETIREAHAMFDRGDIPGVLASFDEAIDWQVSDLLPHGGSYRGRDEVGGFFQSILDHFAEFRLELDDYLESGDQVVTTGRFRGRGRASGDAFEAPTALVWTVRDGKPVAMREYTDTAAMLAALR